MQLPTANSNTSGNILWSKVPAFRLIDGQLYKVRELINEQLTASAEAGVIDQLLEYMNTRGGKMIRSGLVLLSYRAMCDASCEKAIRDTQYEVIRVAAIVEMIHNATLLHDDVIDEGQKRRGLPTINKLWGNESAVLLGDFLLSKIFKMCADLEPRIIDIIAATSVRVCEGELRQIIQRRNWQLSESEYIDIITEKSAALFSNSCLLGALLAQATETQAQSLADFGLNAGIAFQIIDDLLDIVGNESKTGKTLGSDADKNKPTLATIHLLRVVDKKEKSAVKTKLSAPGKCRRALVEMLRSYGSLEYAHNQAQEFVKKALDTLTDLKEGDAKDALTEIARFMASRKN